jgi:hypothetical protein
MSETRSQLSTYQRVGQIETRVIREPPEEENDAKKGLGDQVWSVWMVLGAPFLLVVVLVVIGRS